MDYVRFDFQDASPGERDFRIVLTRNAPAELVLVVEYEPSPNVWLKPFCAAKRSGVRIA